MKRIIRSKMLRKAFTLAFLVAGLTFIAAADLPTQTVKANECCMTCLLERYECNQACNDPTIYYPGCFTTCSNVYNYCRANCDPAC